MIESLIMLKCDVCGAVFDKHRVSVGHDPHSWRSSVNGLLRLATEEDWELAQYQFAYLCPICVMHDVFRS
jgi:hypothetical protein